MSLRGVDIDQMFFFMYMCIYISHCVYGCGTFNMQVLVLLVQYYNSCRAF